MALSIPAWSRLLDRVHIVHFRAVHSWVPMGVAVLLLLGGLLSEPALLWLAAIGTGVAFGGGRLAWNLGHHDFAPAHHSSRYMGVHVTLTGTRGLVAPFLAVGLYQLFEGVRPGAGAWVFAIGLALVATGAWGFARMHRAMAAPALEADPEEDGPRSS